MSGSSPSKSTVSARAIPRRVAGSTASISSSGVGELVVVTGAVGAGKTTLVRALLGLLPRDRGSIRWNGQLVDDPGTFLVPPRTAYAAQVPRLWSAPLRENLLLGWDASDVDLERVIATGATRRRRRRR